MEGTSDASIGDAVPFLSAIFEDRDKDVHHNEKYLWEET